MSIWKKVVGYVNRQESITWGKTVTRQDVLNFVHGTGKFINWTVDNYVRYLIKAGYMERVKPGIYLIKKRIPDDLTMESCKYAAYPMSHPKRSEALHDLAFAQLRLKGQLQGPKKKMEARS